MAKTSFGVAPPAGGPSQTPKKKLDLPNRMPMEIGKAIKVKRLTPEEEKKLLSIGWNRGQPIPENLAELMDAVRDIQSEATDTDNLPPPVPLDTPPLNYDANKDVDIDDLPPEQQDKYKKMLRQIFQEAEDRKKQEEEAAAMTPEGAPGGLAGSIQKALSSSSDIDIEDDSEEELKVEQAPKESKLCPRCSFPLDQEDVVVVTDEDRDTFLQAADSLQLFMKTFTFMGGAIMVTVRELTRVEQETIYEQILIDFKEKRLSTNDDTRDLRMQYCMTLQVTRIHAKSRTIERPATLAEWKDKPAEGLQLGESDTVLRKAYLLTKQENLPDSVFHLLAGAVIEFDLIQNKLEAQSREPDFWKPRTVAS